MGSVVYPPFKERKSFPKSPQHISKTSLARTGFHVLAVAARDAGRVSFDHFDKSPCQEVGLTGKEKTVEIALNR